MLNETVNETTCVSSFVNRVLKSIVGKRRHLCWSSAPAGKNKVETAKKAVEEKLSVKARFSSQ